MAGLILALALALVAAFAIDYVFELTRLQRVILLLGVFAVMVWATKRLALPWLGHHETELDMALLVERQQKIDSDLVAALQFESADAGRWGSPQLETAVIDYVAEFGRSWNVFEGLPRAEAWRRMALLAVTLSIFAVVASLFPRYVGAFLNRLLLGSAHYPTHTNIKNLVINDQVLDLNLEAGARVVVPYGQALKFAAETSGVIPASGYAELRTIAGGMETRLELTRSDRLDPASQPDAKPSAAPLAVGDRGEALFRGELPKLVDSLDCQLYLGDAWTDPIRLQLVPLPVVEPQLLATPPPYARSAGAESLTGSRQLSVIEGSQVDFLLVCSNKGLKESWLMVDGVRYPLKKTIASPDAAAGGPTPAGGERWTLPIANTPLERVLKPLRWEAQVIDENGLQLEHPLEGFIRIKPDQRPRIVAEVITRHVLPTAQPVIEYRATDDYGLAKLLVRLERSGENGSAEPLDSLEITGAPLPAFGDRLPLSGSYRLNLAPLKLAKGDQLKVTLEAVDYRGSAPGEAAQSEPVVFQVTDESGVLSAISESDERSARQLDAIITRQLGIGGSK